MKKLFCFIFFPLSFTLVIRAQSNVLMSQYFQNMPAFAPALTGANDFLDIRTGTRQQWVGFEGAPKTYFISGYGVKKLKNNPYKNNSVRVSNLTPYEYNGSKIGLGGYVLNDALGAFKQTQAMLNVAIHIPLYNQAYMSLGVSSGINWSGIDFNKLFVLNDNDIYYTEYTHSASNKTHARLNSGLALYSSRYYASYSPIHILNENISGNKIGRNTSTISHIVLGGYRFSVDENIELVPNFYLRYFGEKPTVLDVGARLRYRQKLHMGISGRNDKSLILLLGMALNDQFNFSYSYEYKFQNYQNFSPSSHELIIGIQLYNRNKYINIW